MGLNRTERLAQVSSPVQGRRTGDVRSCEMCGVLFYEIRSRLNRGLGRFCSRQCSSVSLRGSGKPGNYVGNGSNKWKREHVRVAEAALKEKLPNGYCVHHVNENKRDNNEQNLIICSSTRIHALLHVRPKFVEERGQWLGEVGRSVRLVVVDESRVRFCSRCFDQLPFHCFDRSSKASSGRRSECRGCRRSRG